MQELNKCFLFYATETFRMLACYKIRADRYSQHIHAPTASTALPYSGNFVNEAGQFADDCGPL